MKPALWIGIMALLGGILGYIVLKWNGWIDVSTGVVVGALVGALVYRMRTTPNRPA